MPINFSNVSNCAGTTCTKTVLPTKSTSACDCNTWTGRLNDLYFIDCSEALNSANIVDIDWWEGLIADGKIFNFGVGIGGYKVKNTTTFDAGGCGSPSVENIEWQLTYQLFCIDKSSAMYTHEFASSLLNGAIKNYNVVARFCDGENMVLPIGAVTIGAFDNELPEDSNGFFSFKYEFNWKSMQPPFPIEIAGLSSVLQKATR